MKYISYARQKFIHKLGLMNDLFFLIFFILFLYLPIFNIQEFYDDA